MLLNKTNFKQIRIILRLVFILLIFFKVHFAYPQEKISSSDEAARVFALDLEELMNMKVVSASQKSENRFDSPLSASVISKEDIMKAGCTSVMEAFRLVPGVIVREETNGNFQVHLRAGNALPNSNFADMSNTTTLVMINNRPVYNYYEGGTFWETLPVDLNDIERIEIIRGPAAAMYGPNAVDGLINIITNTLDKDGWFARGSSQVGNYKTYINNAYLGYRFNNKLSISASGNMQQRGRHQTSYYEFFSDSYVDSPDSLRDIQSKRLMENVTEKFRNPQQSLKKYGVNGFLDYTPIKNINFNISTGHQESKALKVYSETLSIPLSTAVSTTSYADVKVSAYQLSSQVSYLKGSQTASEGYEGQKWDFHTLDAFINYNLRFGNLLLKPGLTYRSAVYSDSNYVTEGKKDGWINGRREIITKAASLRADYSFLEDKIRLISAVRVDKFNAPKEPYLSYQFSANYKLRKNHFFRGVVSQSSRSPFIMSNYLNELNDRFPVGPNRFMEMRIVGNKDLKLLTTRLFELGYRSQVARNLQLDFEAFHTQTKNYTTTLETAPNIYTDNSATVIQRTLEMNDIPLNVRQNGITISGTYILRKLQVKPFITFQKTTLFHYSTFYNKEDAPKSRNPNVGNQGNPEENNYLSGLGSKIVGEGTPNCYGGISINYAPVSKVNFNMNSYYLSSTTLSHFINTNIVGDGKRGVANIAGKVLLNATVSYDPLKNMSVFVSGKNLLNQTTAEFFYTDRVRRSVLGGINFHF